MMRPLDFKVFRTRFSAFQFLRLTQVEVIDGINQVNELCHFEIVSTGTGTVPDRYNTHDDTGEPRFFFRWCWMLVYRLS